ncbi:WAP four-disulfide core domain protein 8-like isoform X2 [Hemicordylus capensis]|uniref:WAP four-disulfide core domain protein 8-like isoform X2 n=1 Tax=Hemicordylus capensis TaxID=884348 RepID=UPI0023048EDB|nr:WAP four-disulfide core domain protein 8-like isoform X2 [Hemicordylus capensis]
MRSYCASDETCPGPEKCCPTRKVWKCLLPDTVHPGYCPQPEGGAVCSEDCSGDAHCAWDEKCCMESCLRRCTRAVPATPGVCPKQRVVAAPSCGSKCKDDRSCPPGQKCCFTGCSLECVPLEADDPQQHGGQGQGQSTPSPDGQVTQRGGICQLPPDKGFGDAFRTRYFYNATSRTCEKFLYRGHGGNANNFQKKDACLQRCAGHKKPGKCPAAAPPEDIDPCFSRCSTDSSCPGTQKCCQISCWKACLEPLHQERPGRCPVLPQNTSTICIVRCKNDSSCPQPQKCCNYGCMIDCFDPVQERPGRCPVPPQNTSTICIVRCKNDSSCPQPQKCCNYGCMIDCFDPVQVNQDRGPEPGTGAVQPGQVGQIG